MPLSASEAILAGGVVYLVTRDDGDDKATVFNTRAETDAEKRAKLRAIQTRIVRPTSQGTFGRSARWNNANTNPVLKRPGTPGTPQNGPTRALVDKAEKRIRDEYNALSSKARQAGAAALNEQLGTNLSGNESWEQAAAIVAAAGAAAGCAATGVGATVSSLCAMAGSYLGKEIGPYLGDAWDEIEDFGKAVGNKAKGAANKVGDWIGGVFGF